MSGPRRDPPPEGRAEVDRVALDVEALCRALRLEGRGDVELVETHISWVLIRDRDVLKLKKPVALDFLDFTSLEARRRACVAELELNRRLSPDVYLAVVPVTLARDGQYVLGGDGVVVDYAVKMRRLPHADRLDVRLAEGRVPPGTWQALAALLARFHAACPNDEHVTQSGSLEVIRHNVLENFYQSRGVIEQVLQEARVDEVEGWQLAFLESHAELFAERQRQGRIRDGHGDLRLEHVYLDQSGQLRIIDAVEFSERIRHEDVCADIAFLVMDLAWHGAQLEAERLLAAYARASNDYDLYALIDFYQSYRAFVRGKIAGFMMASEQLSSAQRERQKAEARRYFLLSLASERPPLAPPRMVCVGGVIASGKSTVAEALAERWGAVVVDADRTRKSLLDLEPEVRLPERPFSGTYSARMSERTYAEVLRRARRVLESSRSVVVDASFRDRSLRARARALADELEVPFLFLECRCPLEVSRERLRRRRGAVSDGRLEIFDEFVASWQSVDELPAEEHRVVDTTQPVASTVKELVEQLGEWWPRLGAPHRAEDPKAAGGACQGH